MDDKLISELDYVGSSGYTLNDLLVLVNYDVPEGTTKNTKITDLKNYILTAVSADTNTFITGFTYNENTFTLYDNSGSTFSTSINSLTGLTINGDLTVTGTTSLDSINVNTLSASTYQNLPLDVFVTGGTYTNGEITFRNNADNNFTVNGLPIGGAGGQVYYLNISQTQSPYKEFSPIASNSGEQFATVSIPSGSSSTIESFLTPVGYPNTLLIPASYWSFYLHTYKEDSSANFELYCEVYTRTSGGTETYLFSTDPTDNVLESPNITMILTDGYFSGSSIDSSDRILIKVNAINTGVSTKSITLFSEGSNHYSYGVSPFSNNGTLTCDNLSGCSTIQTIESTLSKKLYKSGDTMTGTLYVPTISATTYQNLPTDIRVTGGTFDTNTDTITLRKNDGNTVSITGLTDWYTTGFTYSNNTFSIKDNSGSTFNSTINTMTGLTVNGNLTVTGSTNIKSLTATTTNINGNLTVSGTTTLSGTTNQIGNLTLKNSNSGNTGTILFDTSLIPSGTTNTVSFQNQNGTVALLSDLSSGEPNSKGYYYMENNATATVCTSNASFYKVSGVTSTINGYLKLFTTGSSSNQLVYTYPYSTGSTFTYLKYNVSLSVQTAGGGLTLNFQLRKNSSPIPITLTTNTQGTNQPTAVNLTGIVSAQNNDIFELWVNCTTNTTNVLVTDLTVSLFT